MSYDYTFILNKPVHIEIEGKKCIITDCSIFIEFEVKRTDTMENITFPTPYSLLNVSANENGILIKPNSEYAEICVNWHVTEYQLGIYAGDEDLINSDGTIELPAIADGITVTREQFEQFINANISNLKNGTNAQTTCYTISKGDNRDQI